MNNDLHSIINLINIERENSAGRFLALLEDGNRQLERWMSKQSRFTQGESNRLKHEYLVCARDTYKVLMDDVESCSALDKQTRQSVQHGLSELIHRLSPEHMGEALNCLIQPGEVALLRMIALQLPVEKTLTDKDKDALWDSIKLLHEQLEDEEISQRVYAALHRAVKLTEAAIGEYQVYGARGFKRSMHEMLGELMEVYAIEQPNSEFPPEWWTALRGHVFLMDGVLSRMLEYTPVVEMSIVGALVH